MFEADLEAQLLRASTCELWSETREVHEPVGGHNFLGGKQKGAQINHHQKTIDLHLFQLFRYSIIPLY